MSGSQTGTLADLREALAQRQAATAAQGGLAASEAAECPEARTQTRCVRTLPMPPMAQRVSGAGLDQARQGRDHRERASPWCSILHGPFCRLLVPQPFLVSDRYNQFDVTCTVNGGGLSGQAGAVRHGISRALTFYEPDLRGILKVAGFLTRDSRAVERKKYGKAKARRSFQFSSSR